MANNGKMKAGEFRGRVLASLEYIEKDITFIKQDLKSKAAKKDIVRLQKQIGNIKLTSAIVGGVGGMLTAFGAYLGLKKV